METIKTEKLRSHPLNSRIYGDHSDQELEASIAEKGVLSPILVTKESALISGFHSIVSGHRRYYAAKKLGLQEIPVIFFPSTDDLEIQEALIESNRQREKNAEQKAREYTELKRIISEKNAREKAAKCSEAGKVGAEKRQCMSTRKEIADVRVPQNSAPPHSAENQKPNETRKEASAILGISHDTAEKAAKVVKTIDDLQDQGKTEEAETIRETLNNKSVSKAYQMAKPMIPVEEKKIKGNQGQEKKSDPVFNYTNENIDWARWSWNPMTGCKHGCSYCYARDIAMRYTGHFNPEFHEDRLQAPFNTKIPKGKETERGMEKVFVGSMTDLFGEWFSDEQIQTVLDVCARSKQWTYLFLTKNPKRYKTIQFPENCWVGATADTQKRMNIALEAFSKMKHMPKVKFLSCEPLLERLILPNNPGINWLIVGARSRSTQEPEFQPEMGWVVSLLTQCKSFEIPVYWKPNLKPAPPREWPQ